METGEVAPPLPPEAEAEGDGTEGAGDGGGAGSRLLSFSPPRGWSRGDDGRYIPPPHLAVWALKTRWWPLGPSSVSWRCLRRTASTWATRSALVLGMAPSCSAHRPGDIVDGSSVARTVVRPLTLKDLWAISNYFDSDVSVM